MPANYVLLERIELNASAASVVFNNIPQSGYTDLKIEMSVRSTYAAVVEGVVVRFNGDTTAGHEIPMLITVNDYNDDAGLTSENEALEYTTFKQSRLDKPTKRYFRPTEQTVAGGTTSTDYMKSKWTSTEAPERIHRGLKIAIAPINTEKGTSIGTLCIYNPYYFACRTPK